jgi:hypothetical protein
MSGFDRLWLKLNSLLFVYWLPLNLVRQETLPDDKEINSLSWLYAIPRIEEALLKDDSKLGAVVVVAE